MANEFLYKYFIGPFHADSGYNFVNTIVYAVIALVLLYVIFKCLQKLKVKIDRKFFYALLPFVFFGASLRAFVDHGIIAYNFWTASPGIWLSVAGLFLLCFAIGWYLKKREYWKVNIGGGVFLTTALWIYAGDKLQFANTWAGAAIIGLAAGISVLLYFIFRFSKAKWFQSIGFIPVAAHMIDASATFIAVDFFGAVEKHPLTSMVSTWAGTAASLFVLKLAILLPAIYLIQTTIKEKILANYLLIAVAVLGLSEGLRDLITLILV